MLEIEFGSNEGCLFMRVAALSYVSCISRGRLVFERGYLSSSSLRGRQRLPILFGYSLIVCFYSLYFPTSSGGTSFVGISFEYVA